MILVHFYSLSVSSSVSILNYDLLTLWHIFFVNIHDAIVIYFHFKQTTTTNELTFPTYTHTKSYGQWYTCIIFVMSLLLHKSVWNQHILFFLNGHFKSAYPTVHLYFIGKFYKINVFKQTRSQTCHCSHARLYTSGSQEDA